MTLCTVQVTLVQIQGFIVASPAVMKLRQIRGIRSHLKTIISTHPAQDQFVGSLLFGRSKRISL